ncbi:MAG TPA: hypothetical protein VGB77_19680 [Abditibacteriaceae bacterium]|jgi:hypothetical protein
MFYVHYKIIFIVAFVLAVVGIPAIIYGARHKMDSRIFRLIVFLTLFYTSFEICKVLSIFEFEQSVIELWLTPFDVIYDAIPVLVCFVLFFSYFPTFLHPAIAANTSTEPDLLKLHVTNIIHSDAFLTALNESLPKGSHDSEYGFDYVPYMLQSLAERRRRLEKSARFFFRATICLGVLLSGIVMFFGYVMINDASIGPARRVRDLSNETREINTTLNKLLPSYYDNPSFQEICGQSLNTLESAQPEKGALNTSETVNSAIEAAKQTGNFARLANELNRAKRNLRRSGMTKSSYYSLLNQAIDDINRFFSTEAATIPKLAVSLTNLNAAIPKVAAVTDDPQFRLTELLKRLAIGLIVVTFFLAILRYIGELYRSNYRELVQTDYEDIFLRRFYVAMKCSMNDVQQRKQVISALMTYTQPSSQPPSKDLTSKQSANELDIVKELLNVLSKKI